MALENTEQLVRPVAPHVTLEHTTTKPARQVQQVAKHVTLENTCEPHEVRQIVYHKTTSHYIGGYFFRKHMFKTQLIKLASLGLLMAGAQVCTNPNACNYMDESYTCEYRSCSGCTDPNACNYDNTATINDNDCTYPTGSCESCSGTHDGEGFVVDHDADNDGVCDNADVNPTVASVKTCGDQKDYWLDAGCVCGGGTGDATVIGSTAWCGDQKDRWNTAGCGSQC